MRFIFCFAFLVAACSQEPESTALSAGLFAGKGRDAMCIAGEPGAQRGGFIAYGSGDANCSARGKIVSEGSFFALVPQGEEDCRIPLTQTADSVTLAKLPASCAYYCGPGAVADGKTFRRVSPGDGAAPLDNPAVDFGGEPLC